MKIKGLIDEDIVNYRKISMVLEMPFCTFKCEKECGQQVCQNSALATAPIIEIDNKSLIERYLHNDISKAICIQGLEPFDSWSELFVFIHMVRISYYIQDDIVIYTGYNEDEIQDKVNQLKQFNNIIIKFGRYKPNNQPHYDEILGVSLASDNQYAKRIS